MHQFSLIPYIHLIDIIQHIRFHIRVVYFGEAGSNSFLSICVQGLMILE